MQGSKTDLRLHASNQHQDKVFHERGYRNVQVHSSTCAHHRPACRRSLRIIGDRDSGGACPNRAPPVAPAPTAPPQAEAVEVKVGTGVGDRVPEFEISLTDGTLVSAAELQESQRPAFLFFFSTT